MTRASLAAMDRLVKLRQQFRSMRDMAQQHADLANDGIREQALYRVAYYNEILEALDLAFEGLALMPPRANRLLHFLNRKV